VPLAEAHHSEAFCGIAISSFYATTLMQATIEQLQRILLLSGLEVEQLTQLQAHAVVQSYARGAVILYEGEPLPAQLFTLLSGKLEIRKITAAGKETILRTIHAGELIAPPMLVGNFSASANIVAEQDCQILTLERAALLKMIQDTPEFALQIIAVLTQTIQELHQIVHELASERAIVRLAHLIQRTAIVEGTDITEQGICLRSRMPHSQIASSIGITYEECSRLFKQIQSIVHYGRGGRILVLDWNGLEAITQGNLGV
jgi:CRP-like cAMP-binding protein